jgi:hypothetical protein
MDDLKETINNIDCYSQEGFGKIEGIAWLAAKALEQESGNEHAMNAFYAIAGITMDFKNLINGEAEGVDCNYVSKKLVNEIKMMHEKSKEQD